MTTPVLANGQYGRMNGEIPSGSVPVTTLAGIASLTHLLPELPLPGPLPSAGAGGSLLFHPRVADEANRVLHTPDPELARRLAGAISNTATDYIEVLDPVHALPPQPTAPLAASVLQLIPDLFGGGEAKQQNWATNHAPQQRNHAPAAPANHAHVNSYPATFNQQSPSSFGNSSSAGSGYPDQSPAGSQQSGYGYGYPTTQVTNNFVSEQQDTNKAVNSFSQNKPYPPNKNYVQQMGAAPPVAAAVNNGESVVVNSVDRTNLVTQQQQQQQQEEVISKPVQKCEDKPVEAMGGVVEQPRTNMNHVQSGVTNNGNSNGSSSSSRKSDLSSSLRAFRKDTISKDKMAASKENAVSPSKEPVKESSTPSKEKVVKESVIVSTPVKNDVSEVKKEDVKDVKPVKQAKIDRFFDIGSKTANGPTHFKKPMINMTKLSKEDNALMQKSLKALKENPGNKIGSYNNYSPRAQRKKDAKYQEKSDSESSEDEEGNPKEKAKFFKHTEKERDEEKKKNRDDRRKRKMDDDYVPDSTGGESRKRKLDEDYVPETTAESPWLKRRKKEEDEEKVDPDKPFIPKKVSRKLERKLASKSQKLDPETLMESHTFQKFHKTAELVFDNADEVDLKELEEAEDDAEIPPEILIPKHQAADLAAEAAKLKSMEAMDQVPTDRLVKLLNILSINVRDGSKVIPLAENDDDDDDDTMWLEVAAERVARSAECATCALHIITSKNMSKRVYMEEVIDRITLFLRFHLQNTIYPSYDPVYKGLSKQDGYIGSAKKKRGYHHEVKNKNIKKLYNRCTEMVNLLSELLQIQSLTDTTVLHLSSLGVGPFFVENIAELQLSSLKLVTAVFGKYDKHRRLVLDDILASIARLPSSKRSLRTYQLSGSEHIQMLTALVLQLIQCVVELPSRLAKKDGDKKDKKDKDKKEEEIVELDPEIEVDRDVLVANRYENAMATAVQFLSVFLKKCGSKTEEIDYRPLFENFLQDLLTTVNTPEWPAAELLLSLLGKLLVSKFSNKGTEVALRLSSLDYLGVVAARLRKDAVQSKLKIDTIDSIIASVKEAESEEGEAVEDNEKGLDEEEKRTRFLQRVLLDYLTVLKGEEDPMTHSARHFYISQWYRDANGEIKRQKGIDKPKRPKRKKRNKSGSESEGEESASEEDEKPDPANDSRMAEVFRLTEDRKDYLTAKILPFGDSKKKRGSNVISSHIDDKSALLIVKYLSSKRPFSNSFDIYLKQILSVLTEQSIQVRSKALKCMAMVVQEDPSVLSRDDMQRGVNYSFLDGSTMVREAAVDLVGKFILHKADLIDKYYDMMLKRILDTGVSVRKRVIKILRDICLEFPDYPKIPEICVRMIRRINDEEGIQKLVMDTFQNMWFVPVKERHRSAKENHLLVLRAGNITDVVVACKDTGLEWFEQLLQTLFRPREDKDDATKVNREPPKHLVLACQQIVDCLCESVLKTEEDQQANEEEGKAGGKSHRIVACLTTMYLFAKSRPQLLVNHVQTLQPYLNVRCKTQGDYQIISNVAKTLELTVPLIEHPSEIFLSQLEEASIKLILLHDKAVVASCLSCLGSVVNNVTKNYKLIRDCFRKYFGHLNSYKKVHENDPKDPRLFKATPFFRRALFTVGLLLRHFDFTEKDLWRGLESRGETKMEVFLAMFYFLDHESKEIQNAALQAIGSLCIRHYELMLDERLKTRYIQILTKSDSHVQHKIQVLNNIESYLNEEEVRMMKQDKKWKEYADKENLKEMGDVSSGMASTVIQVYLPSILDSYVHPSTQVRHAVLKCIQLVLLQGLVHPIQIVPYLICMSTDAEQRVAHTADHELQDIEKKYPGFIHMKLMHGVRLSYQLQQVLCKKENAEVVRGFRTKEGELPSALNGFLYSILKATKSQRRAILMNLLKQFDDTTHTPMAMLLYLADNLAYIPYTVIDEPLFLIHHIDIMVSVIGSNILENIKKLLKLPADYEVKVTKTVIETESGPETQETEQFVYDEDLDDDPESVLDRLPDDMEPFMQNITTSQGCLLLLVLKEHLKELYGFNESKIEGYSPSEAQKIYERAVNRRVNVKFNPKATVHILKSKGMPPAGELTEEDKKGLIDKYLGFKELMNKIDKDEDEYDEDGNLIPQTSQIKPGEINSLGMPIFRPNVPTITLPPGIPGTPAQYAPSVNIQNISLSSMPPNVSIPAQVMAAARRPQAERGPTPEPVPESGGYLDPETGKWIEEKEKEERRSGRGRDKERERERSQDRSSRSSRSDKNTITPLKITLSKSNKNTQESPKAQDSPRIPKLKINVGRQGGGGGGLSLFDEMDKSAKERDERRGRKHHKPHKEKHKKKKKKKYKSDSNDSDSESEIECLD